MLMLLFYCCGNFPYLLKSLEVQMITQLGSLEVTQNNLHNIELQTPGCIFLMTALNIHDNEVLSHYCAENTACPKMRCNNTLILRPASFSS